MNKSELFESILAESLQRFGKKGSIPLGWNMNCQQIKY